MVGRRMTQLFGVLRIVGAFHFLTDGEKGTLSMLADLEPLDYLGTGDRPRKQWKAGTSPRTPKKRATSKAGIAPRCFRHKTSREAATYP